MRVWKEFSRFTSFEVGDGSMISFWNDVWCGELLLKESFQSCSTLIA
jgi:hypothetical protein